MKGKFLTLPSPHPTNPHPPPCFRIGGAEDIFIWLVKVGLVSKKTEFYQIELLEILLPVGKKYLWYLWQIWKCSIRQNSVFFQTPCIYSNISILIVKSFKESESLTYHELLTAWRKKITRQLVLEMDASKILNRQGAKEKKTKT